jgi:hypothetical protein
VACLGHPHLGRAVGVGCRVEPARRGFGQRRSAVVRAGAARCRSRPQPHLDDVQAGAVRRVGYRVPQLQGPFELLPGLGRRVQVRRLAGGPHRGDQRTGQIVARHGVVGQLSRGAGTVPRSSRISAGGHACGRDGARVGAVEPDPFPRQEVGVHGLGEQGMAEGVVPAVDGHEDLLRDRLVQRRLQLPVGQPGQLQQQRVTHGPATDGRRSRDPLRVRRQLLETQQQEVGELGGQHRVRRSGGRGRVVGLPQLPRVVGIALAAVQDPADEGVLEFGSGDPTEVGRHLRRIEAR